MTSEHAIAPRLEMLRGKTLSQSFELDRNFTTLGRDPNCDIVLRRKTVSRRHAQIVRREDGYFFEVLGSTSGTQINGQIPSSPVLLQDGDLIQVGDCLFRFSGSAFEIREEQESRSEILGILDAAEASSQHLKFSSTERKLLALLEIGKALATIHDLKEILDAVLDAIFRIFPQCERGFVLLKEERAAEPILRAFRTHHNDSGELVISRTIFNHVMGEGKAILCLDVLSDRRFHASRSAQAAQIRTLMVVPLWDHERRSTGILQIDARDVQAPFSPDDLDLLVAIAGPVSVAVENARLLAEARREQRRLEILAEAGPVLAASFDYEAALGRLARLIVPRLADLCLIDLRAEDGAIKRLAAVHSDPDAQLLVDELCRRFPREIDGPEPEMRVLRTGKPEVDNEAADSLLESVILDPEYLAILRKLDFKSYMIVPLVARGRPLGVLSFVGTKPDRWYGQADLALAEELARCAALAVDNARLYHESQNANRAKDRFLAMLSHELRTPLTPVLVAVSALLDEWSDDSLRLHPTLKMIRRNVELEARLIDDLLDISRIERERLRLVLEVIDVHEAVLQAVEVCRAQTLVGDLVIRLELTAPAHHVRADFARIMQITWNLIHNAAKFTPPGGILSIRSRNVLGDHFESLLIVEFQDTGMGIEPEVLPRIFDAFEQGQRDLPGRTGGLGLGLAISRSLAEAHGGSLTAASAGRGQGSTFELRLATVPSPGPAAATVESLITSAPPLKPLKILLVEDNRDTLRFLNLVLSRHGHEVLTAASLAEARAQAATTDISLLISDIELPDGTGLELMGELRDRGVLGISMSGFGSEEDIRLSLEAGFAAHLTKPLNVTRLEEIMGRTVAGHVETASQLSRS
jgi:signal transduction histidine kinase/ActR/RegA family two-component response regulator/putative methionine-R-sulfoxide reductase with GAF domain